MNRWDEKESKNVSFSLKGKFHQRACPTLHRADDALPPFSPILFSLPSSTIILIMFRQLNMPALTTAQIWGKLAHLHNNKCRFEPIESLLTFKWYKDVISKVCAYPGWLSAWMCREWSNSHVSDDAPHLSVHHWQPLWQCFVIGPKREAERVGGRIGEGVVVLGLWSSKEIWMA